MNRLTAKISLALLIAFGIFSWQVTTALGGSGDIDHYKDRVISQLGEMEWVDKIKESYVPQGSLKIFESSACRNLQANSLGYVRAVTQKMTDRFSESGGEISAINLALEKAIQELKEGRDLLAVQPDPLSLDKVIKDYYGKDDILAMAAQIDLYILILEETDRFNACAGIAAQPKYLVPVANGRETRFADEQLVIVELPPRFEVEEDFLKQRDLAKRRFQGEMNYQERVEALKQNKLFQVLHGLKVQENGLLQEIETDS